MRKINEIMWLIINASFAVIIAILLFSGKIYLYLSPRIIHMVWFGFVVFCMLLVFNILNFKSNPKGNNAKQFRLKYLLFIIPIVFYAFSTPNFGSLSASPNQNLNLSYAEALMPSKTSSTLPTPTLTPTALPSSSQMALSPTALPTATTEPLDETEQEIMPLDLSQMPACVVTQDENAVAHEDFENYISKSLDQIYGKEISMYGFVYKDDSFPENTILVSRFMITCCAADATIAGFHVKVENEADFTEDEWIEVTGIVDKFPLNYYGNEYDFPIITDGTIIRRDAPDDGDWYIYP